MSPGWLPGANGSPWAAAQSNRTESGACFAVGGLTVPIWGGPGVSPGTPAGGTIIRAVEQIGFFTGLGVAVTFLAALALGRLSVIAVRDTRLASRATTGPRLTAAQAFRGWFGRRAATGSPSQEPRTEEPRTEPADSATANQ